MSSDPISPESDDQILEIIEDAAPAAKQSPENAWRILIVDDDPEVHSATRFALGQSPIVGRSLEFISAYSAADGKTILEKQPDIAVILLDVVMEEHDSGLKFVEWMRGRGYAKQRIILRTGQPGYAPEIDVVRNYDINDYRAKGELTQTRLVTAMTAAIRTFEQFWLIEEQRATLEQFAYALAHDFRQTTRQIKVYSQKIAHHFDDDDDDSGAPQALCYLSGAARRLGALVEVMAQYTLLSQTPEIERVEIEHVLRDVREAIDPLLRETDGELKISASGACMANSAMIGHVLQILIANGLQHNDETFPRVEVDAVIEGDLCKIAVRDNGVGIEPEYLEEIFKPHLRLRGAGLLPGTGLGLTLSRRAVEALGGNIWCESHLGGGSTFIVSLPAAKPRSESGVCAA